MRLLPRLRQRRELGGGRGARTRAASAAATGAAAPAATGERTAAPWRTPVASAAATARAACLPRPARRQPAGWRRSGSGVLQAPARTCQSAWQATLRRRSAHRAATAARRRWRSPAAAELRLDCAKPGGEEALCLMRNRLDINIESGSVFLHRLRFADLTAETCPDEHGIGIGRDGAVHLNGGALSVVGCAFERNSGNVCPHPLRAAAAAWCPTGAVADTCCCLQQGGAVSVRGSGRLTVVASSFTSNAASSVIPLLAPALRSVLQWGSLGRQPDAPSAGPFPALFTRRRRRCALAGRWGRLFRW